MKKYLVTIEATQWEYEDGNKAVQKVERLIKEYPMGLTYKKVG